ncbi:MAG: DUF1801 domain-containing protein [Planctomycetes bacterium]|nr:DUF1801 domain-containing protein [Planctomycetota bacterium]
MARRSAARKPAARTTARKPAARTTASTLTSAAYDAAQEPPLAALCRKLRAAITRALPAAKALVWHGSPVWFVGEVPVVGYCVGAKGDVQLLFWNGQAFDEPGLAPLGKFRAAQARYRSAAELDAPTLARWLAKAGTQLWDLDELRVRREQAQAAKKGSAAKGKAAKGKAAKGNSTKGKTAKRMR